MPSWVNIGKKDIKNYYIKNAMITKTKLKDQLENFPEEFSIDELIERLILIEKIEKGVKQSDDNQVISEKELDKEVKQWFK